MNKLILLRHGQSQWNFENKFTGWTDVPLTEKGQNEARKAGQLIKKHKIKIDKIFSSNLQRANKTAEIAIKEAEIIDLWEENTLIMSTDDSLNERDYGDLVGLNKKETAKKFVPFDYAAARYHYMLSSKEKIIPKIFLKN